MTKTALFCLSIIALGVILIAEIILGHLVYKVGYLTSEIAALCTIILTVATFVAGLFFIADVTEEPKK